jgi:hypothetical protein
MAHYRSWLVLVVLLLSVLFSSTTLTATLPQTEDPAALPPFTTGEGIASPALQGWERVQFQGGSQGQFSVLLNAPLCAELNTPACRSDLSAPRHQVGLTVERAESEATLPGDELPDTLRQLGYQAEPATVVGQRALRFTNAHSAAAYAAVYTLELEGVYYHITFSRSFLNAPTALDQILASLELRPAEAPASFRHTASPDAPPVDPEPDSTPAPGEQRFLTYLPFVTSAPLTDNPFVRAQAASPRLQSAAQVFNPSDFTSFSLATLISAARQHGRDGTNPYGYSIPGLNGALFIDCMLRYAGFAPARCTGVNETQSYVAMSTLRTALLASGAVAVAEVNVVPGDILFLNYAGTYCWGGVTVEIQPNPRRVLVATQTRNFEAQSAAALTCLHEEEPNKFVEVVPTRSYLRLDSSAPFASFIAPELSAARRLPPGSHTLSYTASDPNAPSSGIQGFSIAFLRDGLQTMLANRIPQTSLGADLDFPCRALDLAVVAYDGSGNASLEQAGYLDAFVLLRGDADGDGQITEADYALIRAADDLVAGQPGYHAGLDPTDDGVVDAADRLFVEAILQHSCPQP